MAAEGRPSISASNVTSSSGRRTSSSSFQPPPLPPIISARRASSSSSFQLPPLPPSNESLTPGTAISASGPSAPAPPPKDSSPAHQMSLPLPVTPQRKPVLRQKSPLSNEAYFSSPAPSMPGSFPTSPPPPSTRQAPNTGLQNAQINTTAYAARDSPSSSSKSPKRPGSIRNLLSFNVLRKSHGNTSYDNSAFRPASPGGESTLSSGRPSLNKKKSGTFWRRTSSLGMDFGAEGDKENQTSNAAISYNSVPEEEAPMQSLTPGPGEDFPTVKKRKSRTFWKRRSSSLLVLANATSPDSDTGARIGTHGITNGAANNATNGEHDTAVNGNHTEVEINGQETEKQLPDIPLSPLSSNGFEEVFAHRSYSPPPQLPEFIGAGGGLGGEELFKDIQ